MPGRLRQSAGPPSAPASEKLYSIPGLEFDEPLSWRAGKAIAVADLLARLQKLQTELRQYEENEIDNAAFKRLGQDLANTNLLGHKDRGVRAWAVACVVDLLKICAPEAPFTSPQLKDIFTVIISSILPALADPTHAYNAQHYYVLASITEFKSIILISEIEQADSLIIPLVTTCFDIVSGSAKHSGSVEVSKTVEFHLNNLLAIVVDEVNVPQEVTDIIISQFLRIDSRTGQDQPSKGKKQSAAKDGKQGNLLVKEYPSAYSMAKFVCTTCTDRMLGLVGIYFANVIVDASAATQSNGHSKGSRRQMSEDGSSDDESDDMADLAKAHRLIRELWRACPDILINVIPQIENELSSGNVSLRLMATETLGDLTAGIGIAGPPNVPPLDPATYPLPSLDSPDASPQDNPLTAPRSSKPFATVHPSAYSSFLSRRQDRLPAVRAAWALAAGRILLTSAGGVSMSDTDQETLLSGLAQMLGDADEKVRLATIKSISGFDYKTVIERLGTIGGVSKQGSVLGLLAERCRDKRQPVREEATKLLARMWGVASSDIEKGNEKVISLLADAPTWLLGIYYLNDPETHLLLDKVLHEFLLPISFPPIKVQISRTESQKTRAKDKEDGSQEGPALDADAIRVRRMLTLVRSLDAKTRPVFFAIQHRQVQLSKAMDVLLKTCEQYNGGVVDENEEGVKALLGKYIDHFAKLFPDSQKANADLWKFAKVHDRRNYQLIRFAMGAQHDYRTVTKAIKELTKRVSTGPTSTQSLLETLTPLLLRVSLLTYNRSHVPAIMDIARTDENGLGEVANELLKEISARNPEVLKTHILDLCRDLEANAPSASKPEESSAADTLKACAAFARKYPADVPKERKFLNSLTNYAVFSSSPRAAKHAVSIVLLVSDRKEMYAKEILQKALKSCTFSSPHFLSRLAAIAQICLLAPAAANVENDAILKIAVTDILRHNRVSAENLESNWQHKPDDETVSKELALKIMVNRCRSEDAAEDQAEFENLITPIYSILMRLVNENGEITPSQDTPLAQRSWLRLAAVRLVLKLCRHKRRCEELVTPQMFISIGSIVLNPPNEVRVGFVNQLKKYLGQNRLNYRWFTILFLIAFEPNVELKSSTVTWLRSRVQFYTRHQQQARAQESRSPPNVMESVFARLMSLLAHHPDYPEKNTENFEVDLLDFSKYICFYLSAVATEDNISLIFHVSQRIKQVQDAVKGTEEMNERLYVLSDLAQATIRYWADTMPARARGVNLLQTWPGRVSLPANLYKAMTSHDVAQEVAEKNFLPEDVAGGLEKLVRAYVKASKGGQHVTKKTVMAEKKRRSAESVDLDDEEGDEKSAKKVKRSTSLPVRKASVVSTKTPKPKRKSANIPSSEMPSRKSSRVAGATNVTYAERESSEDEAEMQEIDRLASSPVRKKGKGKEVILSSPPPENIETATAVDAKLVDEQMSNAEDAGVNEHNDQENEGTENQVDGRNHAEQELTSSPLKEKNNEKTKGKKAKAPGKSAPAKSDKAPPAKETPTRASGRTQSTRSMKV